ncbi:hypothetical protein F4823DRAFT_575106, partial [Ustulina deusta]
MLRYTYLSTFITLAFSSQAAPPPQAAATYVYVRPPTQSPHQRKATIDNDSFSSQAIQTKHLSLSRISSGAYLHQLIQSNL